MDIKPRIIMRLGDTLAMSFKYGQDEIGKIWGKGSRWMSLDLDGEKRMFSSVEEATDYVAYVASFYYLELSDEIPDIEVATDNDD